MPTLHPSDWRDPSEWSALDWFAVLALPVSVGCYVIFAVLCWRFGW